MGHRVEQASGHVAEAGVATTGWLSQMPVQMVVAGVIFAAAGVGYVAGQMHGDAYLAATGIYGRVEVFIDSTIGYFLLALVPAAIVALSGVRWRWLGLALLIVAVTLADLLGFAAVVGIGGEEGIAEDEVADGIMLMAGLVTVAAVAGYGIGSLLRRYGLASRIPR